MVKEKKDNELGDPLKILLEEFLRATKERDDAQIFPDPATDSHR